ncbi:VRR-NUC domain-containing protein [Vibrio penaeicida]|nr:VRR-NUC domain-containing protein [Vibrio penaeicida]
MEVKGPGDKLQQNQIRWLQVFQKIGINAEVCYVNFPRKNSK